MATTYRRIKNFIGHVHKSRDWKFWNPMYPTTSNKKLIPALPPDVRVGYKPMKANTMWKKGYEGRLLILSWRMTQLVRDERVELHYMQAEELRPYVERLIVEAMKHGDCHRPTMELADFWLKEKQLIHKLFKVLVPRYIDYTTSFTSLYKLAPKYETSVQKLKRHETYLVHRERGLLELKGNPFPALRPKKIDNKFFITNVLLDAARLEHLKEAGQIDHESKKIPKIITTVAAESEITSNEKTIS